MTDQEPVAEARELRESKPGAPAPTMPAAAEADAAPAAASSSGWGWGSLWSAVPTVSTITQGLARGIDHVYDVLEGSPAPAGDSDPAATSSREEDAPSDEAASTGGTRGFVMLSALDRTIGTFFEEGRKIASTGLESSKHLVDTIKHNVESSQLLHQGLDLSEQLLDRGVTVVEAVVTAGSNRRPKGASQASAASQAATIPVGGGSASGSSDKALSFATLFENNCGTAHQQALESLDLDCRRSLSATPTTAADEALYRTIGSLLDIESAAEEIESVSESALAMPDGLEQLTAMTSELFNLSSIPQPRQLHSTVVDAYEALSRLRLVDAGAGPAAASLEAAIQVHRNGLQHLAALAARSNELFIRIIEAAMMSVAQRKVGAGELEASIAAPEQAAVARKLVIFLLKEVQRLGAEHIEALERLADSESVAKANDASVARRLTELLNGLIVDHGDAITLVHEGAKHLLPAFRLLAKSSKATKEPAQLQKEPATAPTAQPSESQSDAAEQDSQPRATPSKRQQAGRKGPKQAS